MIKRLIFIFTSILLLVACRHEEEKPVYTPNPGIEISFDSFYMDGVKVNLRSINTDAIYAMAQEVKMEAPTAEELVLNGMKVEGKQFFLGGLAQATEYTIYVVGVLGDKYGEVQSFTVITPELYDGEMTREEILDFADLDLLPGGKSNKTPKEWDEDRLKPHVLFTDDIGREHWLHEAFLLIGSVDDERGTILCIAEGQNRSGAKDSWEDYAKWWFKPGGTIESLDQTIANGISRIGTPSFKKHKIVISMPDPIMLEYFYNKSSSTKYWGEAFGKQLDFKNTSDQVLAYRWFIDYVRELWEEASPEHLELAGFYILSEILVAKPTGWNYQYKRWDQIIPHVSNYLHEMKYGLYWIPYYQADGYDMTAELGIDYTWIQPNKYWDYPEKKQKKSWSWVFNTMSTYGHGLEIEFEGSHGEAGWSQYEADVPRTSSSILETVRTNNDAQGTKKGQPNPQAARNKALLREYMSEFKKAGYYGKARIATYSGTNAMYELATSTDPRDVAMYLEYCDFIVNNPLRK